MVLVKRRCGRTLLDFVDVCWTGWTTRAGRPGRRAWTKPGVGGLIGTQVRRERFFFFKSISVLLEMDRTMVTNKETRKGD